MVDISRVYCKGPSKIHNVVQHLRGSFNEYVLSDPTPWESLDLASKRGYADTRPRARPRAYLPPEPQHGNDSFKLKRPQAGATTVLTPRYSSTS
jgi:hypothetical protein